MSGRPALVAAVAIMLVGRALFAMSPAQERELGRQFSREARAKLPLIDDVEVVAYVEAMGGRLVDTLGDQPFQYEFSVVRDGNINAFAVPGGYIYVHTGLLTQVQSEDELAGVLGHEVAHVHAHHLARQQEATRFLNYTTLLGMLLSVVQPAIGAGALAAQAAVQLEYRREFEREADYLGARTMQAAGYEPIGMLDFFKRLRERQAVAVAAGIPPYLMTHPLSDERLTNLEAVLRQRQWDARARRPASFELRRVQLLAALASASKEEVVRTYARAAAATPQDGEARYLHGLALLGVGRHDAAVAELLEAGEQGMFVERELGRARFAQRRFEAAKEHLERAVARDVDDPVAQHALGRVLEALGDRDAARAAFLRAIDRAPHMESAHRELGMLAGRSGDEALGLYHLGRAFALRGEYAAAASRYEQALERLAEGGAEAARVRQALDAVRR